MNKAWYLHYDRAIKWIDGKTVHLQIATDVTLLKTLQENKKKAEEYLRQAQKMETIGNLAGGIAHDFNNLLFPIMGMSELLMEEFDENSTEFKRAKIIMDAGKRGTDLVRQILYISRKSDMEKTPVRLHRIIKEALKLTQSTIPSTINIIEDIDPDCGIIMADATQMHQIIINLITNAYHAVDVSTGEIHIGLKRLSSDTNNILPFIKSQNDYIVVTVSDNGCGIPDDIKNKIFDPYFTTKEKGKGTGLGLSVVYRIVHDHDGEIRVKSTVGKGTTFSIYLPLIAANIEIKDDIVDTVFDDPFTKSENILLVDDEESVAMTETHILEKLGYTVTMFTNSEEALNHFKEYPDTFDLLLSDVTMPIMSGDVLAKEILSIKPDMPVLLCTGFNEKIDKKEASKIGIKGFLMKPIVKSDMSKVLNHLFNHKAA